MKNFKRYLSFLLVLAFVFTLVSCKKEEPEIDPNNFTLSNSNEYLIVADSIYRNNSTVSAAIDYLIEALSKSCGITATKRSDSGLSLDEDTYAFLIGDTKFEDSDIRDGFKINDYAYKIKSEKLIVINGGSTSAIFEGVKYFCSEHLGYNGEAPTAPSAVTLKAGTEYTYKGEYGNKAVSINGIPLEEYKIKIRSKTDTDRADTLIQMFGKYNGFSIPVVTYSSEDVEEDGGVICFGALDRRGEKIVPSSYNGYRVSVPDSEGYTIGIAASGEKYYSAAFDKLLKKIDIKENDEKASITFPKRGFQEYEYERTEQYTTKWILDESKTKEMTVSDGVVYAEYHYIGENGKPYRANVLYIDTDKNTFHNGTAQDKVELEPEYKQTVSGQMKAAIDNGLNVVAGINGDLWNVDKTSIHFGEPRGLTIKNGVLLSKGEESFGYFGVTKDGTPVIGAKGREADFENLQMAVGGSHIIVQDSVPLHFNMEDSHCYASHPRTLVGITDDGDVILAVVDGRSLNIDVSNGASMESCADLMASLGAKSAISIDGGGSSTMVVKSGDEFDVKNNPSDGSPRAVINSILVVKK